MHNVPPTEHDPIARPLRACLYRRCGRVGTDVIERAASDAGATFYEGPMCSRDARRLREEPMVIVEDLE